MKELSIEEKAKAYNGNYKTYTELINRLEDVKDAIKKQNLGIAIDILYKPYPEYQITASPELKESEDERIKKRIIEWIEEIRKCNPNNAEHNGDCSEAIAWLEKQGEKSNWKPSKDEMDVLYGLAYITNQYDEHKEEVVTRLYQDLKREFFNGSSYENMFPNTEDGVRRRSTIQILEYARSLDTYNQYGKADIDKNIAWLEKQGEHANFLSKIQVGDKVTRNQDGMLVNLSQLNRVAKKDEKQGEQKLVNTDLDELVIQLEETIGTSPHSRETIKDFFQRAVQKYINCLKIASREIGNLVEENYCLKEKQGKNNMGISEATKQKLEDNLNKALEKETPESWNEFLDKQGEQNLVKHFCDCVHVGCHVNDCKRWCHSYQKEISYTNCNSNCNRYSKLMNHAFNIGETITDGISTFKIADIKDNYYIADDGERVEIYMAHRYYTTIQNLEAQKPVDIEIPFGAKDSELIEETYHIPDGYHAEINANTVVIKKGEQKPADKVEPKFKVEDWVVYNHNPNLPPKKIIQITNKHYVFADCSFETKTLETDWHLWTIQDARDGDVLAYRDGQWIFIYKEKIDDNTFSYHTLYSTIHQDLTINDVGFTLLSDAIIPATKKQCDTLEKAMADAGYTFDFEKKELKKIEQKPVEWSEEDEG